jgi:hypothetical protein
METIPVDNTQIQPTDQSQELNKIINFFLDPDNPEVNKIQQSLSSLFDLLLWAEKRNS